MDAIDLHRWANHPAVIFWRILSDDDFLKATTFVLSDEGAGGSGAQVRFANDQDYDETPLGEFSVEILLYDESYIIPKHELFAAAMLESVARSNRGTKATAELGGLFLNKLKAVLK